MQTLYSKEFKKKAAESIEMYDYILKTMDGNIESGESTILDYIVKFIENFDEDTERKGFDLERFEFERTVVNRVGEDVVLKQLIFEYYQSVVYHGVEKNKNLVRPTQGMMNTVIQNAPAFYKENAQQFYHYWSYMQDYFVVLNKGSEEFTPDFEYLEKTAIIMSNLILAKVLHKFRNGIFGTKKQKTK